MKEKYLLLILTIFILVESILIYFVVPTLAILLGLVWLFNLLLALELGLLEVIRKMRKRLVVISIFFLSVIIVLYVVPSVMPTVMKCPHKWVQLYSSDVLENDSNVLRNNIISETDEIKQKEKEDYIKKEYFDSATYSYNVINTISGILVPLFTFIALVVACKTYVSQKEQTDKQLKDQEDQYRISNFESHLFQMIEQQHKLEEKVVDKYGSFRKLYMDFCVIYEYVRNYALFVFGDVNGDNWKKILLKIANYIFYFGVDEEFMCDKTYQTLIKQYGLEKEKEKLKFLIKKLNDNQILKYMVNDKLIKTQKSEELGIYYRNLFNAIQYIDSKCPYDNEVKKKEYTKLVRTNLSDFAQLMLYYNMQGERGSAWLKKDEVKSPKNDNDCLLTRYKPIKNCAISVENKDIDPRNDGRKELFSDDVIDYELKIGKQDN